MIGIIDYGAGNLKSVSKALDYLKLENKIVKSSNDIENVERLILPGVGNFGEVISNLRKQKIFEPIKKFILTGKSYLGICIGLQLLFESSEEAEDVVGFSIFKGDVKKLTINFKVPHIGWNSISVKKKSKLLNGIDNNSYFYFVHSYYVEPQDKDIILATTNYGINFVSGIQKDNIFGVQFHPEKSGEIGLKILENFGKL